MSLNASVLFKRGQTFGATATTQGVHVEGTEIEVDDIDLAASSAAQYKRGGVSNRRIKLRAMRNITGVTVHAKLLVVPNFMSLSNYTVAGAAGAPAALAGPNGTTRFRELARNGGSASELPAHCRPVDEFIDANGVVNNDICWCVMRGPAVVKTSLANMTDDIDLGDALVAVTATTAAATDSTTGGRVTPIDLQSTAHPDGTIGRVIGLAMTALTTNQTNTDVLVDVGGHLACR